MSSPITPISALTQIQPLNKQSEVIAQQIDSLVQQGLTPPLPPLPDLLSWWIPKSGKFVRPVFVQLLPDGRIAAYYMKTSSNWPWDIKVMNSVGMFDRVTENNQNDAQGHAIGWPPSPPGSSSASRIYTNPNPSGQLGMQVSPRYYDPAKGRIMVVSYTALTTEIHTSCTAWTAGHLGPVQTWVSLQKQIDFGGQLSVQDTIVCEFFYTINTLNPLTFKTREDFYLTQDSGWVKWDMSQLQPDGTYKVVQATTHNTYTPDTTSVPVFPCSIAL